MATRIGLAQQIESEVNADTICYSAAISACEKSHEWQLALDLLSRIVSEVKADTICYSAALGACEKRHEWQLALDLLSRIVSEVEAHTICIVRRSVPARKPRMALSCHVRTSVLEPFSER